MNKRHGMMAVLLVALLLATSCSTFFTGSVTGKVMYQGTGVGDALVAVYFDEGQCNADLANYKNTGHFNTQYVARTSANQANLGEFQITNIPWDSCFPEYGKDADEQTIYVLFYHDDFDIQKYEASASIVSGRNNHFQLEFKEKLTEKASVTVQFMNPETKKIESGIKEIKVSYEGRPGYSNACELTVPVNAGVATFDIYHKCNTVPKFDITDINYVTYDGTRSYVTVVGDTIGDDVSGHKLYAPIAGTLTDIEVDANNNVIINTIPLIHEFAGFRGSVTTEPTKRQLVKIYDAEGIVNETNLADKKPIHKVLTIKPDERATAYTDIRGLGNNIVLENAMVPVAGSPEVSGYPAIIENDYIINIDGTSGKNLVWASSDSRTWMDISVSDSATLE